MTTMKQERTFRGRVGIVVFMSIILLLSGTFITWALLIIGDDAFTEGYFKTLTMVEIYPVSSIFTLALAFVSFTHPEFKKLYKYE